MGSYADQSSTYFFNLKHYGFKFTKNEFKGAVATIGITAFVYSFRQWGGETFDFVAGITNLGIAVVLVTIAFIISQFGQRVIAIHYGYNPEYQFSLIGLMIAIVIAFASRGVIVIVAPGVVILNQLAASRLGEFRYYTNNWEIAKACFGGPFANFIAAVILTMLPIQNSVIQSARTVNILFAIYSLAPIPTLFPGGYMFYTMKYFWAFATAWIVSGCILLMFTSVLITMIVSFLIGVIMIFHYFFITDKKCG